ncbi:MAG: FAD-dependent oxidoreductase, partial [Solobacterium sp.]|nr:FAD-dependent oxidoreductase [Solobacterium sp.]
MKKLLTLLLALMMVLSLSACSKDAGNSNTAVSGTFEGESTGMQGPVKVSMTVEEGKITAVELTEIHETPSVASVAMTRIPEQIVEHQTTTVDTVTGATLCSNAIMRAATDAAKNAGLDMDALNANAYHAEKQDDISLSADVIVVGAGGAGFSAAIQAAQNGASVIMIEKSSVCGGNTLMQGGAFNANDPEGQAASITTVAEYNTLNNYLALSVDDENLH